MQEKMILRKFLLVFPILLILAAVLSACSNKTAGQDGRNILFADDFSKSNSGWTQSKNNSGVIEYVNNYYHMAVNKPATLLLANPGKSFQGDVSIEVDARKIGGSDDNYIGVLCHYQNPDNYYVLMLTSDGYSGIARRKDGQDTLISPGLKFLKMDGIKKGSATNHIRADCIGEALTLYANGKQVSLAYDKSLTGGDTGLAVRSGRLEGGVDIRFNNFSVASPAQP
jgi:predicted small secreted protein